MQMSGTVLPSSFLLATSLPMALLAVAVARMHGLSRRRVSSLPSKPKPVAFIFDLDGTLIDFEGVAHDALQVPLKPLGKTADWKLHATISGKPVKTWAKELLDALNVTEISPEEYGHLWHLETLKSFPTMQLMPGALTLVQQCKARFPHAKIGLATSSMRDNYAKKILYHPELEKCFEVIVTGDEIVKGKPDPDIFLEAAKRLGVDPRRCVIFEDSLSGALGAKRSGALVVAIPDHRMEGTHDKFGFVDFKVTTLKDIDGKMLDQIEGILQQR